MDFINKLMLEPNEVHLAVAKYLLVIAGFVHFTYIGLVLGSSIFSFFFNIVDRDTPSHDARTLSKYLIDLAAGNIGLMVYLGVLPLVTLTVLYAQVLYQSRQLTAGGVAVAAVLVALGLFVLALYRKSFAIREANYPLHIVLGASALGLLTLGAFVMSSGVSLSLDPEKWPVINNPIVYLIFSWNNIARFALFMVVSFAITGTAVLFHYFGWPDAEREPEESYNVLVRNFASGLAMGACLLIPILLFWNLITIPDVGKSLSMYHTMILALFALALAGRFVYGVLVHPERAPGVRPLLAVLAFVFLLTLGDSINRENAFRDHTGVLMMNAEAAKLEIEAERQAAIAEKAGGDVGEGNPAQGKMLSQTYGCLSCHSVDGTKLIGPTWKGLYGHEVAVMEGSQEKTVSADDDYIVRSVRDPNSQVVKGYPAVMPAQTSMSNAELGHIVAYIKSLK